MRARAEQLSGASDTENRRWIVEEMRLIYFHPSNGKGRPKGDPRLDNIGDHRRSVDEGDLIDTHDRPVHDRRDLLFGAQIEGERHIPGRQKDPAEA